MGKKVRGAALRAKKRADAAQVELVEHAAEHVETKQVTERPNEQLFVLDTTAKPVAIPAAKKSKKAPPKQDPGIQEKEEKRIRALLKQHGHDAEKLKKLAAEKVPKRPSRKQAANFDLWGDEGDDDEASSSTKKALPSPGIGPSLAGTAPEFAPLKAKPITRRPKEPTVAVAVAHSGQSYHPDPQKHQDVIGEALALELRRKEAQSYKDAPISKGLKAETKALLVGDESSEDDDESDESDKDDAGEVVVVKKKRKLTRVERNRQKRVRAEEKVQQERKRAKKALNAVHEVKRLQKELEQKEVERRERKEWIAQVKQQDQRALGVQVIQQRSRVDPIGAPTLPVALTDELQSSLRTVKPKGSLLTERMESFRDRKMADQKRVGDRKRIVQGKKRRIKVKAKGHDVKVTDESGRDYLLMG